MFHRSATPSSALSHSLDSPLQSRQALGMGQLHEYEDLDAPVTEREVNPWWLSHPEPVSVVRGWIRAVCARLLGESTWQAERARRSAELQVQHERATAAMLEVLR